MVLEQTISARMILLKAILPNPCGMMAQKSFRGYHFHFRLHFHFCGKKVTFLDFLDPGWD